MSTIAERSGAAVEKLNDPTVTRIAQTATEADRKHDAAVTEKLFPAMERNDMAAAYAALAKADQYVRIPLEAQEKIEAYVSQRQAPTSPPPRRLPPPRAASASSPACWRHCSPPPCCSSSAAASAAPRTTCSTA